MKSDRVFSGLVFIAAALPCTPASAFFHLWRFSEVFSNADGSVQFIELGTTSNGENFATGSQIRSLATGNLFTFPSDLSSSQTANKKLLIATAGFEQIPGGVTPDFILPAPSFFDSSGDTLTLFLGGSTFDSKTFDSVPTDGILSRHYPAAAEAVNSPTNFAGASGSVDLSAQLLAGDYNGNGAVEQADLDLVLLNWGQDGTTPPGGWVQDLPAGPIDQAELDGVLLNWGSQAALPGGSAIPEPGGLLVVTLLLLPLGARRIRRWRENMLSAL
jgi:hypothetical protein